MPGSPPNSTRAGVARACLVGLAGVVDNEYILECAQRLEAVGWCRSREWIPRTVPMWARSATELCAMCRGTALPGIKLHPRLHGYDPLADACLQAIRAAPAADWSCFSTRCSGSVAIRRRNAADTIDRMIHAAAVRS